MMIKNQVECFPSLEESQDYVYSMSLQPIINKMIKQDGWSKKEALEVSLLYRNFLYLNRKYGSKYKLPPTAEIDEMWHNHILDTQKYRIDCVKIFGRYFDHYPYFGIDDNSNSNDIEQAFSNFQRIYLNEFGSPIKNIRFKPVIRVVLRLIEKAFILLCSFVSTIKWKKRRING
jgi:hypothetical protein